MPSVQPERLPRSLYADTARPRIEASALKGERRAAVAVVGAGFTGLSTALHLAQQGTDVVVLEAHEPGWGASGRNGGQVNPGLKHEPDAIEKHYGRERGARMAAFAGAAPQMVFDLIREYQIRCDANQAGTIRAAFSRANAAFLERATAAWQARGAPVAWLDRDAIAAATGTTRYCGGALDRRGGSVNPLGYVRGLAEAAVQAGAKVHGGTPVTRLGPDGKAWRVDTPEGSVTADWIVLATNGYTGDLWPALRRSIVPMYTGIAATTPLPAAVAARILPGRAVLYEHESITVYYRLDESNRLLMGGRSHLRPAEGAEAFRDLSRYASRLFPFLGDAVVWSHGWNGQVAITTDHYPHLHEPAPGVIACLGYNGRGIAMATAMGSEIARRIGGAAAEDLALPLSPIRPIPLHPLWPVAARARLALGRAQSALAR